jgi:hypothetical protein
MEFTPVTGNDKTRTPLEEIPEDFRKAVEEVVEWSLTPGNTGRLQTEAFPAREDADAWLSVARSYAYQRPDELGGRVTISGNAAKAPGGAGGFVARIRADLYVKAQSA